MNCKSTIGILGSLLIGLFCNLSHATELIPRIKVVKYQTGSSLRVSYPEALPSLIRYIRENTYLPVAEDYLVINSFADKRLLDHPFVYVNASDRSEWVFSPSEVENLKKYLDRGGFIYIDAGIRASFLGNKNRQIQNHSFGDWQAAKDISDAFAQVYPQKEFVPLKRSHSIFRSYFVGLPDPDVLPDTVKKFVIEEKWPQGTYSLVGLHVNGRLAVVCSPVVAMGWGVDALGRWKTNIGFRIREEGKNLGERISQEGATGSQHRVRREDGSEDVIYLERQQPAWVFEKNETWRIFNYYHSAVINDYAHRFFTRFGVNIFVYAMTQDSKDLNK